MRKLLSANFMRLQKDKFFWGAAGFMVLAGIFFPVTRYLDGKKTSFANPIDDGFFACALLIGMLMAIFCSLFIGTEHSDGTLRNKIIAGQKRTDIYMSNIVTSSLVGILLCAAFFLPYLCVGIPLLGFFEADIRIILLTGATVLLLAVVSASVFTWIAMLWQNRTAAVVACILAAYVCLGTGAFLDVMLSAPKTITGYTLDENRNMITSETPNPRYLEGAKRELVQTLYDINPGGQAIQCVSLRAVNPARLPVYSVILVVLSTGAGVYFFNRKDLR